MYSHPLPSEKKKILKGGGAVHRLSQFQDLVLSDIEDAVQKFVRFKGIADGNDLTSP